MLQSFWSWQEQLWINDLVWQGAEEQESGDEGAGLFADRYPTFAVELAHRDVQHPLTFAQMAKTIGYQIGRFADPHSVQAGEQQCVGLQIVAAARSSS